MMWRGESLRPLINKRNFKACDGIKTAVYKDVCEDFEAERNAEITLLDYFTIPT